MKTSTITIAFAICSFFAIASLGGCREPIPPGTFSSECTEPIAVLAESIPVGMVGDDFDVEGLRDNDLVRIVAPGEVVSLHSLRKPTAYQATVFSSTGAEVYWWGAGVDGREEFVLSGDACPDGR